ncbi:uncharacterized protein TOT_040000616 [Theileria orientalis strain Shintoku]|uniref:ABC transporter n=1 Tax=Theileria orientalis strain Shintoku TaxID=869250 RepID=J4C4I5_THEOR|nr:uncharacterized protein TOT_040000616 [Theileria orientalis strain Shintoku]BAM42246.1 uncharacterized protein TOT_040000616 [Theileria orientalis strain Shintoku]|eukprot:XP_009692547.1 uncharacterized protein TOT_040000616 [Theileria orientalis strain Shintoku]
MNKTHNNKTSNYEEDPEPLFWESEVYWKNYFRKIKNKKYQYYNNATIFKYLFYHWFNKWVFTVNKRYVEPYKLHPLPVSDQILALLPVFSKHISDGLVRLDSYRYAKSQLRNVKAKKPYKSILLRALALTIWKRASFLISALIVVNLLSMSIAILVKKLLKIISDKSAGLIKIFSLLHGLCHRRRFANNINGSNQLNVCNQVLHSCSPDSECSKNPLFCQALRYQNKDINSRIFNFEFIDSYYVSHSIDSLKYVIEFLTNFIYGVILMSFQIKINVWVLYVVGLVTVLLMILMEILGAYIFKFVLQLTDDRINKTNDSIPSLSLIKNMLYDDIAINIITRSRNNELSVLFFNLLITFFNMTLYTICISLCFYTIQRYFVKSVNEVSVVTDIDTAGYMATFYIFLKIIYSMFLIPRSIKSIGLAYVSFRRIDGYIKDCSPNFYISDNRFTGSTQTSTDITSITNQIPNDVVVYYKDATFTWVNTRDDLINKNYEPLLKNINFELKRGEMAVVTGSKGAGKSNFIKSMLGEMTLVGGSMAVIPLHTSMPIFYASQDIFLQQGTIRSNIVFGHKFDDNLYNTVLKAVELEYDISTWEKGDLRVVSDNAHSLSGGQRVRVEMARAIYAYLVFHKVNKEYNNSQCSFLMCLDASFHGLDPYVSKTIFNNLFNSKTGLLVKRDLSVVLAMSKQSLDICSKTSDLTQVHNPPLYKVKNNNLIFHSNLHDFIKVNKPVNNQDYKYLSSTSNVSYEMNYLTDDMLSLCSSGFNTRLGRMEVAKEKYGKSFSSYVREELSGVKFNTYKAYMSPALGLFIIYLVITTALTVLDNIKFILSTRLSDYITKHINQHKDGQSVDLSKIKAHSKFSLNMITLLVSIIIILSFLSTVIIASSCIIVSRKLHEYCINAIFKYSSSVLKINNQLNQVITYLSCDTCVTDHVTGLYFSLLVIYLIQTLIHIITLFYLIPISIPFFILTIVVITKFLFLNFIVASKNLTLNYLETLVHINTVSERAISGSSIYRSFKREQELSSNFTENTDYYMRSLFVYRTLFVWSSILFNWIFSFTTLVVLVLPIILDRCTKYKMKVGYFGLGLSLCMNVTKTFTKLTLAVVNLEMCLISLQRVRYFIPRGETLKFDKFLNTHQEYLVNPFSKDVGDLDKKHLLRRRAVEFKADNKKFYILRKLFFNPRLTMVDIANYLPFEHSEVVLEDVSVYTTPDYNPEGILLNHFSASVCKSEIIGMVGRTGAGKTTLLSVLQNVVENRTGQVLLDGKDLNDIPKVVLRQIIGVLPQLPFVFKGWTIRRFLDPRKLFSDDEINQALNDCGLLEFVNDIPGEKKLDSVLVKEDLRSSTHNPKTGEMEMNIKSSHESFESNVALSNTQLRTLSLARLVLYRHFYRMILVDEPPEEDLVAGASGRQDDLGIPIYDLLQKYFNHCSTFVAAHDANVLKACTSVWVIYEGSLVKTCKTSEISANESIASIIEECVKYS